METKTQSPCKIPASISRRRARLLSSRVQELEASLEVSLEKAASERRGRVRVQQNLRMALGQQSSDGRRLSGSDSTSYPMAPIGYVQSCFSTRNGTPRQPLLVPLSRACLVFDPSRASPDALDGLVEYSHCWIIYVFHLNTDLEKLWNQPSGSKLKAKVRVPRLKGGKMGVLATRSPHRPCPIGLSVAKIEAIEGHAILLSGVDLVDGTPVLDVKPYLPYSDIVHEATIPKWLEEHNTLAISSVCFSDGFHSTLSSCWSQTERISLYASMDEFQTLIKQVLSWDIRSTSQRIRPHKVFMDSEDHKSQSSYKDSGNKEPLSTTCITYHLVLEGVDISYSIDDEGSNVFVEEATLVPNACASSRGRYSYSMWAERKKESDVSK